MKTKNSTKPIFALTLLLGALSWGGCGDPCEFSERCPQTSTTINAPDTIYYPYLSDFDANGKIYTYQIKLPYGTFTRSYKMTEFKHHSKIELAPLLSEKCDPSTSCDTFITRWYKMVCEDVDGNGGVGVETYLDNRLSFTFYDKEFIDNFGTNYSLTENYKMQSRIDTLDFDQSVYYQIWVGDTVLLRNSFTEVSKRFAIESGDTIFRQLFNKENGLIHYKNYESNEEIRLLKIQ